MGTLSGVWSTASGVGKGIARGTTGADGGATRGEMRLESPMLAHQEIK